MTSNFMRSRLLTVTLLCLSGGHLAGAPLKIAELPPGPGVVVIKPNNVPSDRFATAAAYEQMKYLGVITEISFTNRKILNVPSGQIVAVVPMGDIHSRTYTNESDAAFLRDKRQQIAEVTSRFPTAAPLLKEPLAQVDDFLQRMELGEVWYFGTWMTREAYQQKLQAEAAQKQAYEMAQAQAEEQLEKAAREARERAKREADDLAQRQANLHYQPTSMAAKRLLQHFSDFEALDIFFAPQADGPQPVADGVRFQQAVAVPRVRKLDTTLFDGVGQTSMACLCVMDQNRLTAIRIAVPLQMESSSLLNSADLKAAREFLSSISPEAADWLPLGIASARLRLKSQNSLGEGRESAVISQKVGDKLCDLNLTPTIVHPDGNFYAYLSLTLH